VNYFWLNHLKKDSKKQEEFEGFILNSQPVLNRAIDYVNHKAEGTYPTSVEYSNASWAYLQADRNGYLRALADVEAFLNVSKVKPQESIKQSWLTKTKPQPLPPKQTFFKRVKHRLSLLKIW
jgi:hypothetical protein